MLIIGYFLWYFAAFTETRDFGKNIALVIIRTLILRTRPQKTYLSVRMTACLNLINDTNGMWYFYSSIR